MLRYVAFVWDFRNTSAQEQVRNLLPRYRLTGWDTLLDAPGLALVVHGSAQSIQRFPAGCGALLGSLFPNPDLCPFETVPLPAQLTHDLASRIVETRGAELIERHWGDYVSIYQLPGGLTTHVIRGPASDIDCLHVRLDAIQLYVSDVESCAPTGRSFSIDWLALARSFIGPEMAGRTHLSEVRQIAPGCSEEISGGRVHQLARWRPANIAHEEFDGDRHAAARALRGVTRACVQARAAEFPGIVVGLSGGLDSSITLACLADAPTTPRIVCLNQFAEGDDSDERYYARLSAAKAGCELVEYLRDDHVDLRTAVHQRHLAINPGLRIPSVDRIEPDFAKAEGAQAIFRGHGGDELYNRNRPALYLQDRLRNWRAPGERFALAAHAAFTEGVTIWEVLFHAIRECMLARPWKLRTTLARDVGATPLHPDVMAHLMRHEDSLSHLGDVKGLPPGRLWQLSLLCARRNFTSPFDGDSDPAQVSPLLSQPVIELCLRIPTWYQIHGQRDRALARDAFRCDLAPEIYERSDKGGGEALASSIIERNLPFLRQMLLEGRLASSGIIDRARLEATLSEAPSALAVASVPVFDALAVELFARAWDRPMISCAQNFMRNDSPNEGCSSTP